jgi:uncharacterized protein YpmS
MVLFRAIVACAIIQTDLASKSIFLEGIMRSQILVPLVALAVAAQACCCCTAFGPQPPYDITPSDEAVRRFEERMESTETAADGSFTITVTDEEMTSLIAQALAQQEQSLPISEPQVHFRNGRAEFYAMVRIAGPLALPTMVALSITTSEGDIEVTVEEIALGPVPIPESILESLADAFNESLAEGIKGENVDALITDVQVGEGQMSVTGQIVSY